MTIDRYSYWTAADDGAHGEADAQRIELLRALWQAHRLVAAIGPFDGASFWLADGRPHARVIRTTPATSAHRVDVLDVDPSPRL